MLGTNRCSDPVRPKSARLAGSPKPQAGAGAKDGALSKAASPRRSCAATGCNRVVAPGTASEPRKAWQEKNDFVYDPRPAVRKVGPGFETPRRSETPQRFAPGPGLENTRRSETPQRFSLCRPPLETTRRSETTQRFALGPGLETTRRNETPQRFAPGPGQSKAPRTQRVAMCSAPRREPLARISTPSPRRRTVIGCSFSSQKAASQVSARDTLIEQLELQVQSQQLQLQQLQQQQKQQQASCNYSSNSSNSTAESDAPRGQVHCYADQHLLQGAAATCSSDEEKSSWRFMVAAMKKHLLDDKQVDVLSKFDQLAEENEALLADKFEARLQLDDKMNDCELEKLLKPSMKVRELRASEKALAMQKRYSEAEQLKSEANSIEQEEFARKAVVFYEGPAAWRVFATQQDHKESWKALQRDLCVDFEKLVYEGHLPSP